MKTEFINTSDFEVSRTGTHRTLMLHVMALKAALRYIDEAHKKDPDLEAIREHRAMLELLRAELGEEYQNHD